MKLLRTLLTPFCITLLTLSTSSFAGTHQSYKGEIYKDQNCPTPVMLMDGFYIGVGGGYDMYRIQNDVEIDSPDSIAPSFSSDPKLLANGGVGGGFLGYGMYFNRLYLGLEGFGNWSGADSDYTTTVNSQVETFRSSGARQISTGFYTIDSTYKTDVDIDNNYGVSLLPGFRLNNTSLLYVRLGYNWAKVKIQNNLVSNTVHTNNIHVVRELNHDDTSSDESSTIHGFNYGLGAETILYKNFSVRAEYTHTNYNSIDNGLLGTETSFSDNQYIFSVIYHV